MTYAQVVKTSVTNNSFFHNYPHPDDHTIRTTDTPGFKPFINMQYKLHCTCMCSSLKYNLLVHWTQQKWTQLVLLQCLWHLAANSICFKVVCEQWKVFQPCPYKFSFRRRVRYAASRNIASCHESGSFSCLIWPCSEDSAAFEFWWQKCSDIHNKSNHV